LRAWSCLGLHSDFSFRILGLLIGLTILPVLWWNARQLSSSTPILALLLFALSPVTLRWGDSLRAYGLGILFVLLFLGLIWTLIQRQTRFICSLAMLAAVLAVQSLYQNAFVIGSICLGGLVVTLRRRNYRMSGLIVLTGIPAALSLLPYWGLV